MKHGDLEGIHRRPTFFFAVVLIGSNLLPTPIKYGMSTLLTFLLFLMCSKFSLISKMTRQGGFQRRVYYTVWYDCITVPCPVTFPVAKSWQKVTFMKSRLFTNVLPQWLQRYLFTPGENSCSCVVESEADWACAVDLIEKVSQLPFQSVYKCSRIWKIGMYGPKRHLF